MAIAQGDKEVGVGRVRLAEIATLAEVVTLAAVVALAALWGFDRSVYVLVG
ncbi:hypothetical protein [Streptomyces decoyicus]|uniref:hypothetical protein n=1 Tax=Streptomyces decoyicus TaxID=249567 RepID=UPI003805BD9B